AEWTTVSAMGVDLDLPVALSVPGPSDCGRDIVGWASPTADRCAWAVTVSRAAKQLSTGMSRPGLTADETSGYVDVGDHVVDVADSAGLDHATARRILASARPEGDPVPDVETWESLAVGDGFVADVPVGGEVDVEVPSGDRRCSGGGAGAIERGDGRWTVALCTGDRHYLVGPTQALTDVAAASVREGTTDGWTTLTVADVAVDVPPGWRQVGCARVGTLLPAGGTCASTGPRATVLDESSTRYVGPYLDKGLGSVLAGSQIVSVEGAPFATARRILASARPVGTAVPDLAEWEGVEVGEVYLAEVPVDGAVEVSLSEADVDCRDPGGPSRAYQREDGRWAAGYCGDRFVDVVGPTQALTDLVALSVRERERESDDVDDWTTMSVGGISVDVPSDWSDVTGCSFGASGGSVQPPGSNVCDGRIPGVVVSKTIDATWTPPGVGARQGWVFVGTQTVGVDGVSTPTRRRILASARPVGTGPPDVTEWRTVRLEDGITAVVPGDPAVEVTVSGAIPSCTGDRALARPAADGRWQVGLCADHIVTVTAPTQALADLVASQVEGY
ncbi:hypothetical protein, partial [Nocardioides plantarum]